MRLEVSLESYDAERRDFQRVIDAIGAVRAASSGDLLDLEWLHEWVCSVGLSYLHPPEEIYADMSHLVNGSHQGITQYPVEFAKWLRLLADQGVRTYLEIGCYNGNTACLAAAYLSRFHPGFRAVTLDLVPWFLFHAEVRDLIPLEYRVGGTSFTLRHERFDAVFIDGDHSFPWAWADYDNAGRNARICGIHDIDGSLYRDKEDLGGVPAVWERIKREEGGEGIRFHEIGDHPGEIFGIGVRLRGEPAADGVG